jgi:hypothetical protein
MTRLEIILSGILFVSLLFNMGVFVYARAAITRLLLVSEELGDLQNMIDAFAKHTKSVYELESFYGDPTLQYLLNHAVSLNEQLENFEFIYSLTEQELNDNTNETNEETPPVDSEE